LVRLLPTLIQNVFVIYVSFVISPNHIHVPTIYFCIDISQTQSAKEKITSV